MRPAGLLPDLITYSASISACDGPRQWAWVLQLWEDRVDI